VVRASENVAVAADNNEDGSRFDVTARLGHLLLTDMGPRSTTRLVIIVIIIVIVVTII